MKVLEFEQMEATNAGHMSNRECMIRGTAAAIFAFTPLFGISIGIVITSSECFF